jgi:hypothetical protein
MEGNGQTGASVEELVAARLDQSEPGGRAADLVLASLLDDDDLHAVLTGTTVAGDRPPQARPPTEMQLTGLYLRSIEVEGFRGIVPKAALRLRPGPGLTVVAGPQRVWQVESGRGCRARPHRRQQALVGSHSVWRDG